MTTFEQRRDHLRNLLTAGEWVRDSSQRVIERWHPEDDRFEWVVIPVSTHVIGYEDLLAKAEEKVSGGIVARHYWHARYGDHADAARAQAVHETIDAVIAAVEDLYRDKDGNADWPGAVFKDEILTVLESLREGAVNPSDAAAAVSVLTADLISASKDEEAPVKVSALV